MTRIFVYGTLKRGCKNHHHLSGQTYVGEARTAPGFQLHHLGSYPGMVTDPADLEGVTGELWDVDDSTLTHLDDFEGVDEGLYTRALVTVSGCLDCTEAYTYLYARSVSGLPKLGPTWHD